MADISFNDLVDRLDPAMVIVTAAAGGARAGCLVGFHTHASLDPPRYAVYLSKANRTFPVALEAGVLAVHLPDRTQLGLVALFGTTTGDDVDKFTRCSWADGPEGVPLLADVPNRFVGRKVSVLDDGGDHVAVLLEPFAVAAGPDLAPLRLSAVSDLDPGHDPADRRRPV